MKIAGLSTYVPPKLLTNDDLEKLVSYVHQSAFRRNLGTRRCSTLMNDAPLSCQVSTPLQQAWDMMRERKIKALPVLDQERLPEPACRTMMWLRSRARRIPQWWERQAARPSALSL